MTNNVDPGQLATDEASWPGSTLFLGGLTQCRQNFGGYLKNGCINAFIKSILYFQYFMMYADANKKGLSVKE